MLENDLKRLFLMALPSALPDLRLVNRVVGHFTSNGRPVKVGIAGMCDLHGWRRGGQAVEVELKAHGGRLREEQIRFREWCLAWNIEHHVLTARKAESPTDTVARWIEEVRT